ncbi:MAG: NAD(P)-dependent oxidoreductase [Planctomycetota bacterium]|jgi:3-hydroxyisobutyrate dehydrogenase-like beta-hydroxyacid dehydrogenase
MKDKIGLVGLGLVGTAIAERLLAGDFDVVGFDIVSARCQHMKKLGGKAAGSSAEVAQAAKRIVLSLPDTEIVKEVVEGPAGILEAKTPPKYIIDTTTGDPEETIALAQRLSEREIHFLDSTISGSSRQVRDKEAVFMIGGEKTAFETCIDIFQTLSEKIFYLGPSGNGSKAKLASNLILGLNRVALAEGLVFASKLGLEPETFLEMLKVTPAYSAVMDTKGKKMLNDDFTAESRIRQHHKDVSLILKYAKMAGQELPLSSVHLDVLEKAIAAGDGELDNAAIIREIKRRKRN